jgi:molybdopterin synthase catalytic subunit
VDVVRLAELREQPLSVAEVLTAVSHPAAGGTAVFVGTVRDHDKGRPVTRLCYSAHPSAGAELARVCEKVAAGSQLLAVAAVHRTGELVVGEAAVVVAAAAAHRAAAFGACQALIEALKHEVPIWKQQWFADGSSEWVAGA